MNTLLSSRARGTIFLVLIVSTLTVLSLPFFAHAATINVADGDVAGLVTAINTANNETTNPGADTIRLAANGTYTITVAHNGKNGLPQIKTDITIQGRGATILRNSSAQFRFLYITPNGDLTLNSLTLSGGQVGNTDGGAVFVYGGKLKMKNGTISGNTTTADGGGIFSFGGEVTLTSSVISGNIARRGGGIAINPSTTSGVPQMTVLNSTISGNIAQGAPTSKGGGIFSPTGIAKVYSSTVAGNSVVGGAGGGIFTGGTLKIKNSIIADNTASAASDCSGAVTSLGYNLIENTANCTISGTLTGNITGTDPMLGVLSNNGGETMTHLPQTGSPVIDAVPLADCTKPNGSPVTEDQRNIARPQPAGGSCDIGSVEVEVTDATITSNLTSSWSIAGVTGWNLPGSLTLDLDAGTYTFAELNNANNYFVFTVDANGIISYDPSLASFLSGSGTHTLTVNGFQTSVTSHLTSQWSLAYIGGWRPAGSTLTLTTMPGFYDFSELNNASNMFRFAVDANGNVAYDPALSSFVSGSGTPNITVNGFQTSVTSHLTSQWSLAYIGGWRPAGSTLTLTTMPGFYDFSELNNASNGFRFTVDANGNVTYDPALSNFVSGSGTPNLTVNGFQTTVTSNLPSQWSLAYIGGWRPAGSTLVFTSMPGIYSFAEYDSNGAFDFLVDANGLIQSAPATFLSVPVIGNGTAALTVGASPGVTITNNMTSPSWGIYDMFNTLDHVKVVDLAPGNYLFVAMEGFGPLFAFTVAEDGTVTSPACSSPAPFAECGNSYLTVNGFPVNISGFPSSNNANISPTWSVNNIPGFHQPDTSSLYNLIPGNYQLYMSDGFGPIFSINVGADGTVSSDACSAGTPFATCGLLSLVINGFPMSFVHYLSTSWGINNIGPINSAGTPNTYNLVPGAYQLYTDSGFGPWISFTVDAAGLFLNAPTTIDDAGSPESVTGNGTSTLTLGAPACTPPPSDLLAWWPGDGDATDIVGGYDGTLQGGATFLAGKVEQAFDFNGGFDQVSLVSSPSGANFTITGWVQISQYTIGTWPYQTIYADNTRGFWLKDGHLNWWAPSSDKFVGTQQIPLNTWTHIALTYSGGTFTGYVNGVLDGSATYSGEILPTGPTGIGGHASENIFGDIDELQIFDRALSQTEIQSIVDAGSIGQCKP